MWWIKWYYERSINRRQLSVISVARFSRPATIAFILNLRVLQLQFTCILESPLIPLELMYI